MTKHPTPLDDATDEELAKLNEHQRTSLTKLLRDRWSYKAIAAHMAVPVGTVRSRINRARSKIERARAKAAGMMEAAQ